MIRARVVGELEMEAGSGTEPSIFVVPEDVSRFEEMHTLEDIPERNLREIEQFFVEFKPLERDEKAEMRGWHSLEETHETIRESSR